MIKEPLYKERTIGEIVTNDFRAAEIFTHAGIDFCCGGKKSLEQACIEKNINVSELIAQLNNMEIPERDAFNFKEWPLDFLTDYIMTIHHKFVLRNLPDLIFYTKKIAAVHGEHHPELIKVASLIEKINSELLQHLKNEEEVLFPAIKEVLADKHSDKKPIIHSEINRMLGEHDFAGGAMDDINLSTSGYQLPADACNSYRVAFQLLKNFEDDLHVHVHLENNILFPKALKL